jgi:hypothetical protein
MPFGIFPDSAVLDLGSGYCEFINQINAGRKYAMDLNPATSYHAADDVRVLLQDSSTEWQISPDTLDAVLQATSSRTCRIRSL